MEQTIRRIKEEGFPMGITMNLEKPPMLTSQMRT
jgi:hypothetical protein